jgi:2,3-bisphosphoglycerate-independent phosphoglycerate mutase
MKMERSVKSIIIVGDGMADYPIKEHQDKTPLMMADKPYMDWLARHGEIGLVQTIPEGFNPGSEIANLSIFGYDPLKYYTGRGPLEAASLGVALGPSDLAFRCNLVTLQFQNSKVIMEDFSAGHISNEEAERLIEELNRVLGSERVQFFAGVSYRHLMVLREGASTFRGLEEVSFTPPHDIIGQEISPYLPKGNHSVREILELMEDSQKVLRDHPINLHRQAMGLRPANAIWLWGQGRSPQMVTLRERFGIEGAVISAVHLIRGIGRLAGLEVLEVPHITGFLDTNYEGKATYALEALRKKDFVYIHVEAPDEAGHMGELDLKIKAIEDFDERVVGRVLKGLQYFEHYRIMVLPDHPTPLSLRTHTADPVPFVIYRSEGKKEENPTGSFDEVSARRSGLFLEKGHELIERFLLL